jgi:hypothetical protein
VFRELVRRVQSGSQEQSVEEICSLLVEGREGSRN